MCKNSDAALRLDSFAFVTSLQKRTAETPGSQRFPLIALCVLLRLCGEMTFLFAGSPLVALICLFEKQIRMTRYLRWILLLSVGAFASVIGIAVTHAAPSFEIEVVKTGLDRPWSINFAPDGRLFFTARNSGRLYALKYHDRRGAVLQRVAAIPVSCRERGGHAGDGTRPGFCRQWLGVHLLQLLRYE
jgi:hypothetical protein